jgi:hypothetical protein
MIKQKHFHKVGKRGILLGAVFVALLAKYEINAGAQSLSLTINPPVVVAPAVIPDNYIYYPSYGVYYNQHNRQYYYQDGNVWVNRSEPMGVSIYTLQASPFVNMNFHDSPEHHHAEMQRQYPRNWRPDVHHDDHHDQRDQPDHHEQQDHHDDRKDVGHTDNES